MQEGLKDTQSELIFFLCLFSGIVSDMSRWDHISFSSRREKLDMRNQTGNGEKCRIN